MIIVAGILAIAACVFGMLFISFCVTMFLCIGLDGSGDPAVIGTIVFLVQFVPFVLSLTNS